MNQNQNDCKDSGAMQTARPGFTPDSRMAWHRPTVTIIDVKRTMLGIGGYFDGLDSSIS
jgi:hypothetical protein